MRGAWRWLGRLLAIGVISFALLEIASRILFRYVPSLASHNTDAAWRLIWANRRHDAGTWEFYAPLEMHDPLLGWKNRPNFRNRGPLFGADRVTTNSKGARGQVEYEYRRNGRKRIVVVGDSFAFGHDVNDEEAYAVLLGSSLPDTEVINLSVVGYGIDQMLLMITSEALKYSPDLIIVGFISDDIERNLVSFRNFAKPRFVRDAAGRLTLLATPVPPPDAWMAQEPWRPKALDTLEIIASDIDRLAGTRRTRAFQLTWSLWNEMARVAHEARAEILFVFEPSGSEILLDRRADLVTPDSQAYRSNRDYFTSRALSIDRFGEKLFVDFTEKERVASLNLAPAFRDLHERGEKRVNRKGHWNAFGHAVAAAEIVKMLQARGWPDKALR